MNLKMDIHGQTCQTEIPGPAGYRPCGEPAVTVVIPVRRGSRRPLVQVWRMCWEHLAEAAREEAADRPLSR